MTTVFKYELDDLSKEVQELKRNKKRLINPITGERLGG